MRFPILSRECRRSLLTARAVLHVEIEGRRHVMGVRVVETLRTMGSSRRNTPERGCCRRTVVEDLARRGLWLSTGRDLDSPSVSLKLESGRLVCAWCRAPMGAVAGLPKGAVSHGLCGACLPTVNAEIESVRQETKPCP